MSQGWLHVSSGIAERWKNWGIVSFIARVVALLAGLPFGPDGLAIALVVVGWSPFLLSVMLGTHLVLAPLGDQGGGRVAARRHNRLRRRLVVASSLFLVNFTNTPQASSVDRPLRIHLSFDSCGRASSHRAD